jgi:hypothetical protein
MLALLTDVRGLEALDRHDQVAILRRTYADVGRRPRGCWTPSTGPRVHLAGELSGGRDTGVALARYEELMRPFVDKAQDVTPIALRDEPALRGGALGATAGAQRRGALAWVFGGLVEKLSGARRRR